MNYPVRLLCRFPTRFGKRALSTSRQHPNKSSDKSRTTNEKSPTNNFADLQGLLSGMKIVRKSSMLYAQLKKYGNSDMFNYATNKKFDRNELKAQHLDTWNRFLQYDIDNSRIKLPSNGFEELISLTEEGKLWKYPIDNEQGMEAEQQVPFEDHVFLDEHLQDFPKDENIQAFMQLVISGLAKNNWMTVDRKQEVIKFYKQYFDERKGTYREAGLEI